MKSRLRKPSLSPVPLGISDPAIKEYLVRLREETQRELMQMRSETETRLKKIEDILE